MRLTTEIAVKVPAASQLAVWSGMRVSTILRPGRVVDVAGGGDVRGRRGPV